MRLGKCLGIDARLEFSISVLVPSEGRGGTRALADLWREGGGSAPRWCQQPRLKHNWTAVLWRNRHGGAKNRRWSECRPTAPFHLDLKRGREVQSKRGDLELESDRLGRLGHRGLDDNNAEWLALPRR